MKLLKKKDNWLPPTSFEEKIKHLTHLAKKQSQLPNLMDTMEEYAFEDILDRLHKYHSRKQMIEKYLT